MRHKKAEHKQQNRRQRQNRIKTQAGSVVKQLAQLQKGVLKTLGENHPKKVQKPSNAFKKFPHQ
ncbi:hypothetical protein HMPREF1432_01216 [Helicobacter pylori GAMchJs114i]|nr:hypothetical protein HMPREF1432_01216 [Helicobacter pylori GAMchJs114i]